jgi:chemotaxis methyl-accepting protein methylase
MEKSGKPKTPQKRAQKVFREWCKACAKAIDPYSAALLVDLITIEIEAAINERP